MSLPALVSVIVPTRDEAEDIERCLEAIAAQDYPMNRLEVIVVDGCSTDETAEVAHRCLKMFDFAAVEVVENKGATASSNLNVGLSRANGEFVCRVDARTRIEPHYVRTCVDVLANRPEISVVGGAQIAIARDGSPMSAGIARALNNRLSMGGSPYRRAKSSGESDTVYLGAFRRTDLDAVGGWDERFVSNQDFDLNRRMAERGLVWFDASLRSGYLPRATLGALWRQYRRFGRAKVAYWRLAGTRPENRQVVMLAAPVLLGVLLLTFLLNSFGRRWLAPMAVVVAVSIDEIGTDHAQASPVARACALTSMATVTSAWLVGAYDELVRELLRGLKR